MDTENEDLMAYKRGLGSSYPYTTLPDTSKICFVVNTVKIVGFDICVPFTEKEKEVYDKCITNEVSYRILDPGTLEFGPLIVDTAYRARLKGIKLTQDGNCHNKKKKILDIAEAHMKIIIGKTGGVFRCVLSDIDTFRRVLIELYDPVTGESINEMVLKKYKAVATRYNSRDVSPERKEAIPRSIPPKRGSNDQGKWNRGVSSQT